MPESLFIPKDHRPMAPVMGGPLDGSDMPTEGEPSHHGRFVYLGLEGVQEHHYALLGRKWLYLGVKYGGDESIGGI